MNAAYMKTRWQPARRARKIRLESCGQTKKPKKCKVFFSPSLSPFVAGGDVGGSGLDPGGGRGGPKVLFSFSVGGGDGEQGPPVPRRCTLQQLLLSTQSPPPPHLAAVPTVCLLSGAYRLGFKEVCCS
jgi:hypothetical protein